MPDAADSPALFLLFGKQRRPNPFPQRLPEKHSLLPGLFPTGKYHRSGYLYAPASDDLLVAHDVQELDTALTLDEMYLDRWSSCSSKIKGAPGEVRNRYSH